VPGDPQAPGRGLRRLYRRCQAGQKPGFPRFKASRRFDSVQWEDTSGWKLDAERGRLRLLGVGDVKVHLHRPTRGNAKALTVAREGRRWWVTVRCVGVPAEPLPAPDREVGLDLGVCALLTTSDGEMVTEGRYGCKGAGRLAAAQRALVSKRRGSGQRRRVVERVARAHRTVHNRRKDLAHKVSRRLVNDYDLIVHEDLAITNMVRRPKPRPNNEGGFDPNGATAKAGRDRSIHDSGWGQLLSMIAYKAEEAGREMVAVNPCHTSQRCSQCGYTAADNRVTQAMFQCQACGHQAHADVNAAINILWAGRAQRASARGGSSN
jgi:putative transposase